jgi:hypothetical protein
VAEPGLVPTPDGRGVLVQQLRGRWAIEARIEEHGGRLVIVSLVVSSVAGSTPEGGVTAQLLRGIKPGDLLRFAREWEAWAEERGYSLLDEESTERLRQSSRKAQGRPRGREWYAQVAMDYLAALREAPSAPIPKLVDTLTARGWPATPSLARDWVRLARDYGWLTRPVGRGRPGGTGTPQLRAWVRKQQRRKGGRS